MNSLVIRLGGLGLSALFLLALSAVGCGQEPGITPTLAMSQAIHEQAHSAKIFVFGPRDKKDKIVTCVALAKGERLYTDNTLDVYGYERVFFDGSGSETIHFPDLPQGQGLPLFGVAFDSAGNLIARGCTHVVIEAGETAEETLQLYEVY